jgi:hypothetical protein
MSEVNTKLLHETHEQVKSLANLVPLSNKRFYELTSGYTREEIGSLSEDAAQALHQHLLHVADYFFDFSNIIAQEFEKNQIEATTNAAVVSKILLTPILDRISQDLSSGTLYRP